MREKFSMASSGETSGGSKSSQCSRRKIIVLIVILAIVLSLAIGLGVHFSLKDDDTPVKPHTVGDADDDDDGAALFPLKYKLTFWPDTDVDTLYGKMDLVIQCSNTTSKVVLDSVGIHIFEHSVAITEANSGRNMNFLTTIDEQTVTFKLPNSTFEVGLNYTITLTYEALINHNTEGVFKTGQDFVATFFQPNYASRAFPCFDDPRMKAVFQLTIVRPDHLTSISNVELNRMENWNNSMVADIYNETPKMSPYLLAFVVCNYQHEQLQTASGKTIRFYSKNTNKNLAVLVNFTKNSLEFFEDYFDMPYTLPKLDVVPVDTFRFRGMENWGLILLSGFSLPESSSGNSLATSHDATGGGSSGGSGGSSGSSRGSGSGSSGDGAIPVELLWKSLKLIMHEIIHQWIGNVVTTGSWRSSWYIEGVTQYLTLRHISQLDSHFLQNREDLDSYRLKAMSDVSIVPTNDIQGPLMFLVLEELIGEENLRNGIRKFLKKYAMKNAVEDDFWGCFEEFGKEKDMSVRATMREWTDQENYPLVTADFDHQTNSVKLSQKVFSYEHGKEGKWTIPITIEDAKNKTERHFMLKPDGVTVPVSASSDWFTVNVRGFYRVNYGVDTWTFLTQQLMEDHTVIKAAQRANLISDSWALVKANMLDVEIFLRLLDYMEKEKDYLPWIAFFGTTSELFSYSQQSENLPLYMTFFQEKIKNIYQRVAYNEDGSLGLSDRMLESGVVSQACQWEYAPCLAQAIRMFKRWKDNPEENKIPIQHLRQVMCIGVQDGSTADCMFVRDQLKMQPPSVAYRMRWALTCSSKPWVLQSMLNGITHSNDTTIDMLPSVLALLANNPEGVTIVNRFFKENCPTNTSVVSFSNYTSIPCHRVKQAVSDATDLTEFNKVNIGPSTNIHLKKQKIVEHIKDFWVNRNLDKGAKVLKELSYDKKKILSASKRLPQDIRPISYELVMKPDIYGDDPAKFTFTGSNTIQVLTVKDLRVISIHSYRLNIVNISVERHANDTAKTPSAVPVTSTTVDEDKQMFNILLAMKIPAGTSMTIKLDFEGDLKRQLNGFYLSSYYKRGNLTYLATTHFEPTFARKAFPCFDEPQLKATFQVTLLRKGHYKTISNTPRMKHVTQPDGWVADYYHRTPKMSTYLLAMIVCDFEFKSLNTSDNTQVGIWVRAEALGQTSLALNDSKSVLEFYARYFNASYPIAKLDLIAIPDFDAGAMENWGLVTYRETNLLYDPASQSKAHSDRVTYVVAHELAHQWFGNLVTMCWWNDLWLNEGFATYISTLGIQHAYPQTRQFEYFVLDTTHAALEADGSTSSHPLNVPIRNRHDIVSAFDSISYNKGASILHMLRISLGDTVFQQGLQRYISDHSYSNAQHNDLWLAFNQEAAVHHQTIDVNDTMEEWVNQMNYPVVFVQWNNSQLVLSQRIFQFESQSAVRCSTPAKQIVWKIPFTYTTDQEKNFTVTPHNIVWFTSERKTLNATTSRLTNQSWVLANLNQFGFYRVNYDLSNWESLVQQLNTDHSVLPVVTRAQLINDAWSLAKAGMLSQEIPFKLLDYMDRERDDIALRAIITEISFIKNILRKNSVYGMFEDLVKDKLKVTFNSLTDKHSNVYTTVFSAACQYNLPECIAEAKNQFNDWKSNISRNLPNPISVADIRMTCYCTGIRSGTKEDWHIMFQRYLRVLDAMEKRRLLYSLACTSQVWLLEKYLLIAMKGEEIRPQDFSIVLSAISSNPIGAEIIWKYIKQDWDTIRKKFGGGFALDNIVQAATSKFVDESQLKEVEQFMDDHSDLDSARQTFLAAIEEILTRVKWRNNNWTTLNTWLRTHT